MAGDGVRGYFWGVDLAKVGFIYAFQRGPKLRYTSSNFRCSGSNFCCTASLATAKQQGW